jgi:hypothetical protein
LIFKRLLFNSSEYLTSILTITSLCIRRLYLLDKETENKAKSTILKIVQEKKPETVRELISIANNETRIKEIDLLHIIQNLQEEKKFEFYELTFPESTLEYLFSQRGLWFWFTIAMSILSVCLLFIPESLPIVYTRNVIGLIFVFYLPGYTLTKVLYPISVPLKMRSITLDSIERLALSIGLSLTLTPTIGLTLYLMQLGLNILLITLSVFIFVLFFALFGISREYQAKKSLFQRRVVAVTEYELLEDSIRFFDKKGFMKQSRVLIREIFLSEITRIDVQGNELSVTSNGVISIFFLRNNSMSFDSLAEKITIKTRKTAQ